MKKVLLSALACGYLVAGINDGLVVHYEFEGNANDSSGNGNNGTEYGGVEYVDGIMGKAGSFDGVGSYIRKNNFSINIKNDFTISTWINTNENPEWYNPIFSIHSGEEGFANYGDKHISLWLSEPLRVIGYQTPKNEDNGNYSQAEISNINTWYHIIYTEVDGIQKIYINGIDTTSNKKRDTESGLIISNGFLEIGAPNFWGNNGGWSENGRGKKWNGLIDDLRIYDRALSEDEIKELYYLKNCECNTQTSTCDESKIYSQDELDSKILEAKNEMKSYCENNPSECGIMPETSNTTNETTSNIDSKDVKLELRAGWNLVSIPGYTPYSIDKLFAPEEEMAIVSNIKSVFAFDVEQGGWLSYVPGNRDNSLINLYPGQGFWVNNKYNMSYEFNGEVQIESLTYKGDGLGNVDVPPVVGN